MAQLRQDYSEFIARDTVVIAIGPETTAVFKDWWHEHKMPFTGIADPKHEIADLYGQQVKLLRLGRLPASLLIDKIGRVRYRHFGSSMSDIPNNREVLSLLDQINGTGTAS